MKLLCTTQGALALLPAYRTSPALQLSTCPIWRQAMRSAGIKAKQELPQQPTPATWQEVTKVLDSEKRLPTFAAILIAWMTCARTGCVLQLATEDVVLNADGTLSVRFRKGKSVRARGPYCVHTTTVPPRLRKRLTKWMSQRRHALFTGAVTGPEIKVALRRVNPQLEQRSLRRGALQQLATSPGITDAILMEFSGHTQVLRRYLNWGKAAHHLRTSMQAAATPLVTPTIAFERTH